MKAALSLRSVRSTHDPKLIARLAAAALDIRTLSIAAILAESAQRYPDRVAVVLGPQKVTYEELWREVRLYATVLRDRGIGPGDRVALLIPNVPDFPRFYYAVLSLGAVVVPVHALLRPEEIQYVLHDSGASLLCAAGPLVEAGAKGAEMAAVPLLTSMQPEALPGIERIEDLAAVRTHLLYVPLDPDTDAVILYTSGTTGQPKGAVLSHLSLTMNAHLSATDVISMRPGRK